MEGIVRDSYNLYLKSLPDGKYEYTLRKPKKDASQRSIQQNRYLFGVVYKLISEETGYTDYEVHEIFKTLFLKKYLRIGKKEIRITESTTKLNTKEFESYCESIRMWCSSNLGFSIPEPNEIIHEKI